ncbi:MAG: hypothetical protein D6726_12280 [Nitrospirae bacterium]|nr:MAG: hypothetical protein D6726_12280 [Nitrospirota bacterium]
MSENKIHVEPINISFAKSMEVVTWIGIAGMLIFGVLYLTGISSFVDMKVAISNWHEPVTEFWQATKGIEVAGYGWFLSNLGAMDCLSMIGIAVLAISPLAAMIVALGKSDKAYKIFFLILILEFLFAIVKPLIMAGGGE